MMTLNSAPDTRGQQQQQQQEATFAKLQKYHKNAVSLERKLDAVVQNEGPFHSSVKTLQETIRQNYVEILLRSHDFSESIHLDHLLWAPHHKVIEVVRNRIRKLEPLLLQAEPEGYSLDASQQSPIDAYNKSVSGLKILLSELSAFYHECIDKLKSKYRLPKDYAFENFLSDASGFNIRCRIWVHRFLIRLGDIARYLEMCNDKHSRNWASANRFYSKAAHTWPESGVPHNQMAVLGIYVGNDFLALYHYIRSLAVKSPFSTSKHNLDLLFKENLIKYNNYKKTSNAIKEDSQLPNSELKKRFLISVVRLNGIILTKSSVDDFDDVLTSLTKDLDLILDVPDKDLDRVFFMDTTRGLGDHGSATMVLLQIVVVLIFSAHTVCQSSDKQSSSYSTILQRPKFICNAFVSIFECVGRLLHRCIRISEPVNNSIAPSLLICLDWMAYSPDVSVHENYMKNSTVNHLRSKSFFWRQVVDFLNLLESHRKSGIFGEMEDLGRGIEENEIPTQVNKGNKMETWKRDGLWEDRELMSFLPLSDSHHSLKFDESSLTLNTIDAFFQRKRVLRFLVAARKICRCSQEGDYSIVYDSQKETFLLASEYLSLRTKEKEKERAQTEIDKDSVALNNLNSNALVEEKVHGGRREKDFSSLPIMQRENGLDDTVNGEDEEEEIVFMPSSKSVSVQTTSQPFPPPNPPTESSSQFSIPITPPFVTSEVITDGASSFSHPNSSASLSANINFPWLQPHGSVVNVATTHSNELMPTHTPQALTSATLSRPSESIYSSWLPSNNPPQNIPISSFQFPNRLLPSSLVTAEGLTLNPPSESVRSSLHEPISTHTSKTGASVLGSNSLVLSASSQSTLTTDSSSEGLKDPLMEWLKKAETNSSVSSHSMGSLFSDLIPVKENSLDNNHLLQDVKNIDFASLDDMLTRLQISARRPSTTPSSHSFSSASFSQVPHTSTEMHGQTTKPLEDSFAVAKTEPGTIPATVTQPVNVPSTSIRSFPSSAIMSSPPSEAIPSIAFSPMSGPSASSSPKRYVAPPVARAQAMSGTTLATSSASAPGGQKTGDKKQEPSYKGFSNARLSRARAIEEANKISQPSTFESVTSKENADSDGSSKPVSASKAPPGFGPIPIHTTQVSIETDKKKEDKDLIAKFENKKTGKGISEIEEKTKSKTIEDEEEIITSLPDNLNFIEELTDEKVSETSYSNPNSFYSNLKDIWGNESFKPKNQIVPPSFSALTSIHLPNPDPHQEKQRGLQDFVQMSSFNNQRQEDYEKLHFQSPSSIHSPFPNASASYAWNVPSITNSVSEPSSHSFASSDAMQKLQSWFPPQATPPYSSYDPTAQASLPYQPSLPPHFPSPHYHFPSFPPPFPAYPYGGSVHQHPSLIPPQEMNYSSPSSLSSDNLTGWDHAYGPKSTFAP